MLEEVFEKTNFKEAILVIIASFAIVCFWRASWGLMDEYLFSSNYILSLFTSLFIGLFILTLIVLYKKRSKK